MPTSILSTITNNVLQQQSSSPSKAKLCVACGNHGHSAKRCPALHVKESAAAGSSSSSYKCIEDEMQEITIQKAATSKTSLRRTRSKSCPQPVTPTKSPTVVSAAAESSLPPALAAATRRAGKKLAWSKGSQTTQEGIPRTTTTDRRAPDGGHAAETATMRATASPEHCLDAGQLHRLSAAIEHPVHVVDKYGRSVLQTESPASLIAKVRTALAAAKIEVLAVNLEGSAASHVINSASVPCYGDLDFCFKLGPDTDKAALSSIRRLVANILLTASKKESEASIAAAAAAIAATSNSAPSSLSVSPASSNSSSPAGSPKLLRAASAPGGLASNNSSSSSSTSSSSAAAGGAPYGKYGYAPPASCDQDHALFAKQFITCEDDRSGNNGDAWAVYSLTTQPTAMSPAAGVDFKFVKQIARPFEFTADSFQIVLHSSAAVDGGAACTASSESTDTLSSSSTSTSTAEALANPNPTTAKNSNPKSASAALASASSTGMVEYTSSAPTMAIALRDLDAKWISVRVESDLALIRGGGLLKYIRFISRGWRVAPELEQAKMVRYMVTRFMIDFNPLLVSRYGMSMPQQALCDFIQSHVPHHDHGLRALVFANLASTIHKSGVPQSAELLAYMGLMVQVPQQHRQYYHRHPQQQQRSQYHQHHANQQQRQQPQNLEQRQVQRRSKSQSPKTSRASSPASPALSSMTATATTTTVAATATTFASAAAMAKKVASAPPPAMNKGVDASVQTQRNDNKSRGKKAKRNKQKKLARQPPSPPSNTAKSTSAWPSLLSA